VAEHINNQQLLSSGGHVWAWGDVTPFDKALMTVGQRGCASFATGSSPRPGVIVGQLRATAASVALAHSALTALEQAIEALARAGTKMAWEDNLGHSGTALVILAYRRRGPRGIDAGKKAAWQRYEIVVRDNKAEF